MEFSFSLSAQRKAIYQVGGEVSHGRRSGDILVLAFYPTELGKKLASVVEAPGVTFCHGSPHPKLRCWETKTTVYQYRWCQPAGLEKGSQSRIQVLTLLAFLKCGPTCECGFVKSRKS
jgi:hypothetical protein